NDGRSAAQCEALLRKVPTLTDITGNLAMPGFTAPKLLWIRDNEPAVFEQARKCLLPKDYIRFKLSGVKATEVSDASGTGIFDVTGRRWSTEMMRELDVDPSLFPRCFESDEVTSHTLASPWLEKGIPIVGGGGDQAAAAVGTGAVTPGVISLSLGTSGVVFTSLEKAEFAENGAAHTFCHANRAWHAMGVMLSCGGAVRWFRDTFGAGATYDELAHEASQVPPGCEGLTFLPYLTGERTPHNDPLAKASFSGATLAHRRAHFSRAVFEGVSFGLRDGFDLLRSLGAKSDEIRVTGGGARSVFWVQMLADVLGKSCVTLECDEGPALGAAILAGIGTGVWADAKSACAAVVRLADRYQPRGQAYDSAYKKYVGLYGCLKSWNMS
ncbi:MAG: xylulokinase, partial [Fimbriimonadaceae bacterium]|nr:xylulokinase [Fimbriimonadaceae bacterium]